MGILDIARSTFQKVTKKIGKDFHDGLVQWKRGDFACSIDNSRSKMKFKPGIVLIQCS